MLFLFFRYISTRRATLKVPIYFSLFSKPFEILKNPFVDLDVPDKKYTRGFFVRRCRIDRTTSRKLRGPPAFLSRFYMMFCTRSLASTRGASGYDKEPLLKRIGNSRKNNVCRLFQCRDRSRKDRADQVSPVFANISICSGWVSLAAHTDVYVSRYWTKVAPSVLDATRSDISPGTGFFATKGRNYETGHFSQTAAGCRNTKSPLPLPWHLSFSLSPPPFLAKTTKYMNSIRFTSYRIANQSDRCYHHG